MTTTQKQLYVNDVHGNATCASQAGIARVVAEALGNGTLPPEAENDWVVVTADWVNPGTDNLDAVFANTQPNCVPVGAK